MYNPESKDEVFKWITERGYSIDIVGYLAASQHRFKMTKGSLQARPKQIM